MSGDRIKEAAMNVKTILAAKGGDIFSIEPTADLAAAAKLLSTHRIGAAVIRGAGGTTVRHSVGTRYCARVSDHGVDALTLPVGQVMTRNVTTCGEEDSIADIMEQMTAGKFRHVPVLKDGQLARSSFRSVTWSRNASRKSNAMPTRCANISRPRSARSRKVCSGFRVRSCANCRDYFSALLPLPLPLPLPS